MSRFFRVIQSSNAYFQHISNRTSLEFIHPTIQWSIFRNYVPFFFGSNIKELGWRSPHPPIFDSPGRGKLNCVKGVRPYCLQLNGHFNLSSLWRFCDQCCGQFPSYSLFNYHCSQISTQLGIYLCCQVRVCSVFANQCVNTA